MTQTEQERKIDTIKSINLSLRKKARKDKKKKRKKILELTRENTIFKCFVSQLMNVSDAHMNDIYKSKGNVKVIAVSDFGAAFNLHSFLDYFLNTYGEDVSTEPIMELATKVKDAWAKHFKEVVKPIYDAELLRRIEALGIALAPIPQKDEEPIKPMDDDSSGLYV